MLFLLALTISGLTPCERELGEGTGRYPTSIASEFRDDAVVHTGRGRNLFCVCMTNTRMNCMIRIRPGSESAKRIFHRLQAADTSPSLRFSPFFFLEIQHDDPPGIYDIPVFFELADCKQRVLCQIQIKYLNPGLPNPLTRSESSPDTFNYPEKTIPLMQCTDGSEESVCPITHDSFEVHNLVYILKSEAHKVGAGKSVACISFSGMNQLEESSPNSLFKDPLRRAGDSLLEKSAYDLYLLVENPPSSCERGNSSYTSSKTSTEYPEKVAISNIFPNPNFFPILHMFIFICLLILLWQYFFTQTESSYFLLLEDNI